MVLDYPSVWPPMDARQATVLAVYITEILYIVTVNHLGITKLIGRQSFHRTFATLLKGTGEDVKTVQELMRHANSRLTLDVYAQALTPAKRAAHIKVVEMIRPRTETLVVPSCSHAQEVNAWK